MKANPVSRIVASVKNLSPYELLLWIGSAAAVLICSILGRGGVSRTAASLLGVTALIFCAKGDVLGQILMVIFSLMYGVISFSYRYYGEMLTYVGMTMPIAIASAVSWIRHPAVGREIGVEVNRISVRETLLMCPLAAAVTIVFYFILAAFDTANLILSTISVTTSFIAAYLTFRRSAYFALAYAANDVVLIVLWIFAAMHDRGYISMAVCFAVFLINDIYGFICWHRS